MQTEALTFAIVGFIVAAILDTAGSYGLRKPFTARRLLWPAGEIRSVWKRVCLGLAPVTALGAGVIGGSRVSLGWALGLGLTCLLIEQIAAVVGRLGGMAALEWDSQGRG